MTAPYRSQTVLDWTLSRWSFVTSEQGWDRCHLRNGPGALRPSKSIADLDSVSLSFSCYSTSSHWSEDAPLWPLLLDPHSSQPYPYTNKAEKYVLFTTYSHSISFISTTSFPGKKAVEVDFLVNLHDRMERLLGSIALWLLNFDRLIRRFHFDSIKMNVKAINEFESIRSLHKFRITLLPSMACNLWRYPFIASAYIIIHLSYNIKRNMKKIPGNDSFSDTQKHHLHWRNWILYLHPLYNTAPAIPWNAHPPKNAKCSPERLETWCTGSWSPGTWMGPPRSQIQIHHPLVHCRHCGSHQHYCCYCWTSPNPWVRALKNKNLQEMSLESIIYLTVPIFALTLTNIPLSYYNLQPPYQPAAAMLFTANTYIDTNPLNPN